MTSNLAVKRMEALVTPERDGDPQYPTRGLPSTAAVAGHPLHPMVVPFPIAFLTTAFATDIAATAAQDPFWSRASKLLLGAGIASGLVAGAIGAIDYFTIRRAREKPAARLHAYGNVTALALAGTNLAARTLRTSREPKRADVALSATTAVLLGVTGWAGGELSYRHMVGVGGHDDQHSEQEKHMAV